MNYKMVRTVSFFGSGLAIVLTFFLLSLLAFPIIGILVITTVVMVIVCMAGIVFTGQDEWVKVIQGEALALFGFDSTGMLGLFPVKTAPNPEGGIDIIKGKGDNEERLAYSKSMVFRMFLSPIVALMKHSRNPETNEPKMIIELPSKDFDKNVWKRKQFTAMFYNMETQTLINRFDVKDLEKYLTMNYLTLHSSRLMRQYINEFRQARKNFFSSLLSGLSSILSSPIFPVIMFILIILVVGAAAFAFFPQLQGMVFPAAAQAGNGAIHAVTSTGVLPK